MCIKNKKCSAWISLESVGISAEGCLRQSEWIHKINVACTQSIFNSDIYIDLPNIKLRLIKNVAHGTFGSIDLCRLETSGVGREVYVKRPLRGGKSLLYEACIQKLVGERLEYHGFPTGAPRVLYIFKLRDNSICFAMDVIAHSTTLQEILSKSTTDDVNSIIVDSLIQLCGITSKLDDELGINHRDLKPSNILVAEHEPRRKKIVVRGEEIEITSRYALSFIDFGFSCIGSSRTREADVSLSSVYGSDDPCPKEGRDMYLFLAFLYVELLDKLPQDLLLIFEKWLEVPNSNFTGFLKRYKNNAAQWIYFLTGNPDIKQFCSCPQKIIRDLKQFLL